MKRDLNISAIILAGGKSSRMNGNKALLPVCGTLLIEKIVRILEPHFRDVIISAQEREPFRFLNKKIVVDEIPDYGPLMGILCGLRASATSANFVVACDIPEINMAIVNGMKAQMDNYDIVVPLTGEKKYEPLFSIYKKSVIPKIETLMKKNQRKIIRLFPLCRTKFIPMETKGWFFNLNTMEDYHQYIGDP
jgi:molybdopterin-guanine dinucleotide biosynthesis protein A